MSSQPLLDNNQSLPGWSDEVMATDLKAEDTSFKKPPVGRFILSAFFSGLVVLGTVYYSGSILKAETLMAPPEISLKVEGSGMVSVKKDSDWMPMAETQAITPGLWLKTDDKSNLELAFKNQAFVRLAPNTAVELLAVEKENTAITKFSIRLDQGKLWVAGLSDSPQFNIFTRRVVFIPERAFAGFEYQDGKATVYSDRHAVRVGLLSAEITDTPPASFDFKPVFLNHFLLTEANATVIREDKITDTLLQLQYSKLVKEFPFNLMTAADVAKDSWLATNRKKDDMAYENWKSFNWQLFSREQSSLSPSFWPSSWQPFLQPIQSALTFLPSKKNQQDSLYISALTQEAAGEFIHQKADEGETKLAALQDFVNSLSETDILLIKPTLDNLIEQFKAVLPGDDTYKIKTALISAKTFVLQKTGEDITDWKLEQTRQLLDEISDGLRLGRKLTNLRAKNAIVAYSKMWEPLVTQLRNQDTAKSFIFEQRQILQNLFYRFPLFFEKQYFAMVSDLEQLILEVNPEANANLEWRLFFINDTLKDLARVVYLIKQQQVGFQSALDLGNYLLVKSDRLQPGGEVKIAVSDYFKEQLAEFNTLLEFFSSPEFASLKGVFEEQAYNEFKAKKTDLAELQKYLGGIKDAKNGPVVKLDQALEIVRTDFLTQDINLGEVKSLADPQYRLFYLPKVAVAGKTFEAKYDRDSKLVYEIQLPDQLLTSGVHISHLVSVISGLKSETVSANSDLSNEKTAAPSEQNLSRTEEIAINLVMDDLKTVGIEVRQKQVKILNLNENLFSVSEVYNLKKPDIIFSFQYNLDKRQGAVLKVKTPTGEKNTAGTYALDKIYEQAEKVYEAGKTS